MCHRWRSSPWRSSTPSAATSRSVASCRRTSRLRPVGTRTATAAVCPTTRLARAPSVSRIMAPPWPRATWAMTPPRHIRASTSGFLFNAARCQPRGSRRLKAIVSGRWSERLGRVPAVHDSVECAANEFCRIGDAGTGTCAALSGLGEPCTDTTTSFDCDYLGLGNPHCMRPPGDGGATCESALPADAGCTTQNACQSGVCVSPRCVDQAVFSSTPTCRFFTLPDAGDGGCADSIGASRRNADELSRIVALADLIRPRTLSRVPDGRGTRRRRYISDALDALAHFMAGFAELHLKAGGPKRRPAGLHAEHCATQVPLEKATPGLNICKNVSRVPHVAHVCETHCPPQQAPPQFCALHVADGGGSSRTSATLTSATSVSTSESAIAASREEATSCCPPTSSSLPASMTELSPVSS